jgi:hypothetical protein
MDRRTRRILAVLTIAGSLGAFAFSSAYFSSTDTTDFATLEAGTIVIDATNSTVTWTGAYDNLLPGASATADLTVQNTGTAGLVYAIAGTGTVDTVGFDSALTLKLYAGACNTLNFNTATPLNAATTFATIATTADVVGDSAPYSQTGDRYIAAAGSESLCVRVSFTNSGSPQNGLQGATADLSLDFNASQIDAAGSVSQ